MSGSKKDVHPGYKHMFKICSVPSPIAFCIYFFLSVSFNLSNSSLFVSKPNKKDLVIEEYKKPVKGLGRDPDLH